MPLSQRTGIPLTEDVGIAFVIAVRRNTNHAIAHLWVQRLFCNRPQWRHRSAVAAQWKRKSVFRTLWVDDDGRQQIGAEIHVMEVNGNEFLRTDHNEKEEDNLGALPEAP